MDPDKHENNREDNGRWKKGVSGNLAGRPPGKTMKEWVKDYLSRLTDEERDEFMKGIPKEIIWKMGEGNPKNDIEHSGTLNISQVLDSLENGSTPQK